jgi:hypothetical protein
VNLVVFYYKNIWQCTVFWMSNWLLCIPPAFILLYLSFCLQMHIGYVLFNPQKKNHFSSPTLRVWFCNAGVSVRRDAEAQVLNTIYFILLFQRVNLKRLNEMFQFKHIVLETDSSLWWHLFIVSFDFHSSYMSFSNVIKFSFLRKLHIFIHLENFGKILRVSQ